MYLLLYLIIEILKEHMALFIETFRGQIISYSVIQTTILYNAR